MKKHLLTVCLGLAAMLSFAACNNQSGSSGGYLIDGKTSNYPANTQVFLQEFREGKPIFIDTTTTDAEGNFSLKGKIAEKNFGKVQVGSNDIFLLIDNKKINVEIDRNNPRNYSVTGNPELVTMQQIMNDARTGKATPDAIKTFIDTVKSPYLAYYGVQYLNIQKDFDTYEKVQQRLSKEIPSSTVTLDFTSFIDKNREAIERQKAAEGKTAMGSEAAEIDLPNPDGKNIALSSLRGKVVLLDFWASWCGPCRRENPNVVKTYQQYKDKGFTVYSVSLDKDKARWVDAIKKDNLLWDNHVSDLQYWNSAPAAAYGVRSIPATFLLDREGKIIGKNLRGGALEAKLKEIFAEI
ncbi:MAG: TlpA disulfide reductase family protein [Chitinophagales bacterium]|nr:AhpC/TSA family protein [Bacteroidota bacterium]MCB9043190.1 AhpC/TSA family protein [Chitinophagales bacterium]